MNSSRIIFKAKLASCLGALVLLGALLAAGQAKGIIGGNFPYEKVLSADGPNLPPQPTQQPPKNVA
jgi:hypothetical protein